jgi:hypothetical protein
MSWNNISWPSVVLFALILAAAIASLYFGNEQLAVLFAGIAGGQILPQPMKVLGK